MGLGWVENGELYCTRYVNIGEYGTSLCYIIQVGLSHEIRLLRWIDDMGSNFIMGMKMLKSF